MRRSIVLAPLALVAVVGLVLAAAAAGHGGPGVGAGKKSQQSAAVDRLRSQTRAEAGGTPHHWPPGGGPG